MEKRKSLIRQLFCTTTGAAMIFCLVGGAAVFLPWVDNLRGYGYWGGSANGFITWHGITSGITFFVLFLLLVATSPFDPVPLWRSILLFLPGAAIVLFASLFIGTFVNTPWVKIREGAYSTLCLGLLLIVLATLEIRGLILRHLTNRKLAFLVPLDVKEIHEKKEVSEKAKEMPIPAESDWLKEKGGIQDKPPRPMEEFGPPV
jgi:hypothetical protein